MIIVVWFLLGTIFTFTGITLWFNFQGLEVQAELIVAFFSAITGELATMGGIQISKHRKKKGQVENVETKTEQP